MRIGCLQFAPKVGDVDNNLNRADAVLSKSGVEGLDLLVLPELAFSGYNFKSLAHISDFLEPSGAGITSLWARTTALKYNTIVAAGYPEKVDVSRNWPTSPEYYNSLIVVNADGETVANYRKSHLYYTDQTWALENPKGFYKGRINGLGRTAMGICMDLNPYRFEAPWNAYEFAFHILEVRANVVIMSMAWLTRETEREFSRMPQEPDMDTLTYWIQRLEPVIRCENDEEIIIIFANRTGTEDEVVYAGTSTVIGIKNGEVSVYGLLGRGDKDLLVVDTEAEPYAKLVYRPEGDAENDEEKTAEQPTKDKKNGERPGSPSPSADSEPSETSDSRYTTSNQSTGLLDVPKEHARRIYGGHVLISQDAYTPMSATFPNTPFEESPLSPQYYWAPSGYPQSARPPLSPTSSTRSVHTSSSFPLSKPYKRGTTEEIGGLSQTAEYSKLMESSRGATRSQKPTQDEGLNRPSSPKSRNCSRTGRGDRSDSALAQRPSSAFARRAGVQGEASQESRPDSRTAKQNGNGTPPRKVTEALNLERQRQRSATPDLEKIGADMMVFEEGKRPRRDSLECHPDEDDFIVLHSSQRDHYITASKRDKSHKKTHSEQANASPKPTQTKSKDQENRSASRRKATPTVTSPDPENSSRPSHRRPSTSHRDANGAFNGTVNDHSTSRDISRGRTRNNPWSPNKASPPMPSSHSNHSRSAAVASPPPPYISDRLQHYVSSNPLAGGRSSPFTRYQNQTPDTDFDDISTAASTAAARGGRPGTTRKPSLGSTGAVNNGSGSGSRSRARADSPTLHHQQVSGASYSASAAQKHRQRKDSSSSRHNHQQQQQQKHGSHSHSSSRHRADSAAAEKPRRPSAQGRRKNSSSNSSTIPIGNGTGSPPGAAAASAVVVAAVEKRPATPKAMVLVPDDDCNDSKPSPVVTTVPLKCLDREAMMVVQQQQQQQQQTVYDRPKSLVW